MTEKQLQAAIVELAGYLGWRTYHTHDSRRSNPGYPDLTLTKDGVALWFELKTAKGRVSDEQWAWLDGLPRGRAFLFRPADWLDGTVERVLRCEARKLAA